MAKGGITINEASCLGCGYCEKFCSRGCIVIPGDKFSPQGYLLPVFANPGRCNACGVCNWMCPHFAIEVYRYIENQGAESS
jgi:formate hydrogenlyase subunit 6/NADH:ubiquinone oxidoreductase subunit I